MTKYTSIHRRNQQHAISEIWNDLGALGMFFLGGFTIIAIYSHAPQDPSWFSATSASIKNYGGLFGSYWSAFLLQLFGAGSFVACLLIFLAGVGVFRRMKRASWILFSITGLCVLLLSSACLTLFGTNFHFNNANLPIGGLFGSEMGIVLARYLSTGGVLLLNIFFMLLTISLTTQLTIRELATRTFHFVQRIFLFCCANLLVGWVFTVHQIKFALSALWYGTKSLIFFSAQKQKITPISILNQKNEPTQIKPKHMNATRKQHHTWMEAILLWFDNLGRPKQTRLQYPTDLYSSSNEVTAAASNTDLHSSINEVTATASSHELECFQPEAESTTPKKSFWLTSKRRKSATNRNELFRIPSTNILQTPIRSRDSLHRSELARNSQLLEEKIADFRIKGKVTAVKPGPVITMYEFKPGTGVKVNTIANLADDLALALATPSVRIEAPIPGRDVVGIEVPNEKREEVFFKEIVDSRLFEDQNFSIPIAIGKDTLGEPVVADLKKMPHLLVSGTTGSGKSVFINTVICSLLYRFQPDEVKLILIDPKQLELNSYEQIPHLLLPVVTEAKKASLALKWAVQEMEDRYQLIARSGMRDVDGYNRKLNEMGSEAMADRLGLLEEEEAPKSLPKIIIVIDELADLMMMAKSDVENSICRLAQKARAAGIHLILATQRPSVDVITGLIKANLPARISFRLSSKIDSRTIFDTMGAERLVGNGDMLFMPPGDSRLLRMHGAFISEEEIEAICSHWRSQSSPEYREEILIDPDSEENEDRGFTGSDDLFQDALDLACATGYVSSSMLQRRFRIGYNRAARIVEEMEAQGLVGPADGSKPRPVLQQR